MQCLKRRLVETDRGEICRASLRLVLQQDLDLTSLGPAEMRLQRRRTLCAQGPRTLGDHSAMNLRHTRGGRALSRRERKDMQERQSAIVDQGHRILEHAVRLGRESGNDVGAEHDIGAYTPHRFAEGHGVRAGVAALHALQSHIVTGLKG